mmetsp:Transcript_19346/g.31683  ORF Transcript_19346/g.31683 Transcript_19346/m.31683 type:complete len:350 (+) Transcript_19346:84-1133(+)|eukprot:CAMPEP_0184351194 /NCGR_PEP_ID=MMETSP1089-20130417/43469_1 /TAXON_ID=38269 ORGANISM="Gloeochaete wittrockiana, Strain SAG46.84" /NCGR_SAMPLE_ID=MMETSP1089 /ASSEMBLY_ACC=CAM_ASM_000445 /LENGTH=349 /DNA_ID=CAMNT_0026684479 /DNA_START=99 /DNA_END=1148 /DNA_ORIENTATION=+
MNDASLQHSKETSAGKITREILSLPHDSSAEHFISSVSTLSLNNKKITEIGACLRPCTSLKVLYLYENSIATIEGLEGCVKLTHLFLQNNRIGRLEGLSHCDALTKLYLDKNCIQRLEGLENCRHLQELHLSGQTISESDSEGLTFDQGSLEAISISLRILNLAGNKITSVTQLAELHALETLDLSHNEITDFEGVRRMLLGCRRLKQLDLHHNPVALHRKFRDNMILASHTLDVLDSKPVTITERQFLHNFHSMRNRRSNSIKEQRDTDAPQFTSDSRSPSPEHKRTPRSAFASAVLPQHKDPSYTFGVVPHPRALSGQRSFGKPPRRPAERSTDDETLSITGAHLLI